MIAKSDPKCANQTLQCQWSVIAVIVCTFCGSTCFLQVLPRPLNNVHVRLFGHWQTRRELVQFKVHVQRSCQRWSCWTRTMIGSSVLFPSSCRSAVPLQWKWKVHIGCFFKRRRRSHLSAPWKQRLNLGTSAFTQRCLLFVAVPSGEAKLLWHHIIHRQIT